MGKKLKYPHGTHQILGSAASAVEVDLKPRESNTGPATQFHSHLKISRNRREACKYVSSFSPRNKVFIDLAYSSISFIFVGRGTDRGSWLWVIMNASHRFSETFRKTIGPGSASFFISSIEGPFSKVSNPSSFRMSPIRESNFSESVLR